MGIATQTKCACQGGCGSDTVRGDLKPLLDLARIGFRAVSGNGISDQMFCCPLCLRLLPNTCSDRAHFPAESVGGRRFTFTCRKCNNFLGTAYEAAAYTILTLPTQAGSVARIGTADRPTLQHALKFWTDGGDLQMSFNAIGSARDPVAQRRHGLDDLDAADRLVIEDPVPHPSLLARALLSWAYLRWFDYAGYSFALGRSAFGPRAILLDPALAHEDLCTLLSSDNPEPPIAIPSLAYVCESIRGGDVAIIALGAAWGDRACSIIPMPAEPGPGIYNRLTDLRRADGTFPPDHRFTWVPMQALYPGIERVRSLDRPVLLRAGEIWFVGTNEKDARRSLARHMSPSETAAAWRWPGFMRVELEFPRKPR